MVQCFGGDVEKGYELRDMGYGFVVRLFSIQLFNCRTKVAGSALSIFQAAIFGDLAILR